MIKEIFKHCFFRCRKKQSSNSQKAGPGKGKRKEKGYIKNPNHAKNSFLTPQYYYFYFFFISSLLMNMVLITESQENPLTDNMPNMIFSMLFLLFFFVFHWKNEGFLTKKQFKMLIIMLLCMDAAFFTHTRLLIDLDQKMERVYFKTSVFLLNFMVASNCLKPMVRLYLMISVTGYVLLNIWIYKGYDIYTAMYALLSYFSGVFIFLFSLSSSMNKTHKTPKDRQHYSITTKTKTKSLKKTMDKNEPNLDGVYLELIDKLSEGVLITTSDFQVKFKNKTMENIAKKLGQNDISQNSIAILKVLKERSFVKKSRDLQKNESLSFDDILKSFNQSNPSKMVFYNISKEATPELKIKLYPVKIDQEKCILMLISLLKKTIKHQESKRDPEEIKSDHEILDLKVEIQSLQKHIDFFTKILYDLIEKHFQNFLSFSYPMLDMMIFASQKDQQKTVLNMIFFQLNLLDVNIKNCSDLLSLSKANFSLNFQSLSLKYFVSEIYHSFLPITKTKGLDFQLLLDDKTPEFIQTDFIRFKQILFILLSNSIKFTQNGTIKLKLVPFQIEGHIIIQAIVQDTGVGINKIDLEKFSIIMKNLKVRANFILDDSENEFYSLTICHLLALELGIEPKSLGLKFDSSENSGSRFSFYILDKSVQLNMGLSMLKVDKINKIPDLVKNYSGSEGKNLLKKNSITCIDMSESWKNPSGKMISANNYKFLDNVELKNMDLVEKSCDCFEILMIDDDFFTGFTVEVILMERNIKINRVYSGKEGVNVLKLENLKKKCIYCKGIQLIIINCEIMKKSAKEITKELVQMMKNNAIPMVKIVGVMEKKVELEAGMCLEAGMKEILYKPILKENLLKSIMKWTTIS